MRKDDIKREALYIPLTVACRLIRSWSSFKDREMQSQLWAHALAVLLLVCRGDAYPAYPESDNVPGKEDTGVTLLLCANSNKPGRIGVVS